MPKKGFLAAADASARGATEIAKTFHKIPALAVHWTRCGKPNCKCSRGELHGPYAVLRWREGGRQRRRYVRPAELTAVRAALTRRRADRAEERLAFALSLRAWRRLKHQIGVRSGDQK